MAAPPLPEHHDQAIPTPIHPLIRAAQFLIADLLSTLIFVTLYAVTRNIFIAAGCAIVLGLGRIVYLSVRGISIDPMQWLSLCLVIVFSGATLLTHNPIFVMLKPTMIYAAVGIVMLRRGWMNRYVPPIAQANAADLLMAFGYIWAALMFATSAANLAVAVFAGDVAWAWFIGIFPTASKITLLIVQYLVTRRIIRYRIGAAKELASTGA
jgi:intracellular septation protein